MNIIQYKILLRESEPMEKSLFLLKNLSSLANHTRAFELKEQEGSGIVYSLRVLTKSRGILDFLHTIGGNKE